jgi:ferrous iron transport protein A
MKHERDLDRNHQLQSGLDSAGWEGFTYMSEPVNDETKPAPRLSANPPVLTEADSLYQNAFPLATSQVGDLVCITALNCGAANNRLMGMGLIPGAVLQVISCTATGSVVVALQDQRLGLGADMAQHIQVISAEEPESPNFLITKMTTMQPTPECSPVKLRDVAIGTTLRVIGYEPTARDYKRKLLAMGLTPGTELRVTRHAPLGDPTEITVRGFQLSLRKAEANALIVAPVTGS